MGFLVLEWCEQDRIPLYQEKKGLDACNMHALQIHEFVLGHRMSEPFVGHNLFVFFKSIIDMQMI